MPHPNHVPHGHCCTPHPAYANLVDTSEGLPAEDAGAVVAESDGEKHPTHIFIGTIITMAEALPQAEALAIKHDKIIAVGAAADIEPLAGPLTKRIELGDRVLYPGLIEPHMHLWVTAINYHWIDCSSLASRSLEEITRRLSAAAKTAKPGEWVLGKLFDPSLLEGSPGLTAVVLDKIAPDNPVFILNASMHFGYVNSKALELAGITKDTPDPAGGKIDRNPDGTPNGILGEMGAIAPMLKHIKSIKPVDIIRNIHAVTTDAAAVGVTTMREAATGGLFGDKEITLLHALYRLGRLKTRLSLALIDENAQKWKPTKHAEPQAGNDHVWVGARKIVADGSNQGGTGYLSQPYKGTDNRGALNLTPAELLERIRWCDANGWQLMIHANGDAAVDVVVDSYHTVLKDRSGTDLRHRIEHCSLIGSDTTLAKMAEVNVTPSFLINHVYYWGKTLRDNFLGKERIHMLDRTASALKAGLKFTLHSDYNVSPINPLHYVKVAATRTMHDGGEVLNADEKVSVYEALRAVTIDAAWQLNADDRLGSLAPGKAADLVILDEDPQQVESEAIDGIKVVQTWLGGKVTYEG